MLPRACALSVVHEVPAVRGVRSARELCVVHVVHEMRVRAGKGGGTRPKSRVTEQSSLIQPFIDTTGWYCQVPQMLYP